MNSKINLSELLIQITKSKKKSIKILKKLEILKKRLTNDDIFLIKSIIIILSYQRDQVDFIIEFLSLLNETDNENTMDLFNVLNKSKFNDDNIDDYYMDKLIF